MTDTIPECREEFERWYVEQYERDPYPTDESSRYSKGAQMEFDVWQAAWNAKHAQLEQRCRELEEHLNIEETECEKQCAEKEKLRAKLKAAEGMREALRLVCTGTAESGLDSYILNVAKTAIKNFDSVEG
ncbi:MAG: hypothetical protein KGJ90_06860 [Patescibacteria group bacterium]|nr:hypothetical protein [Patescibacteria group bacterium]